MLLQTYLVGFPGCLASWSRPRGAQSKFKLAESAEDLETMHRILSKYAIPDGNPKAISATIRNQKTIQLNQTVGVSAWARAEQGAPRAPGD